MKAKQIIDIGYEKVDDCCSSFFNYPFGTHCMSVAEEQVQRFSTDLLADSAFEAGLQTTASAKICALEVNGSALQAVEWLNLLPMAGSKLVTALSSWSQLRLEEEKFADFRGFLEGLVAIIEHSGALITTIVAQKIIPHIDSLAADFSNDPDGAISPKRMQIVKALAEAAAQCQADLSELADTLGVATTSFETLISNVQGVAKSHSEADVSGLVPTAPMSWVKMLWHSLGGLQALEPIVERALLADAPKPAYPHCIDEYFEKMGNRQLTECFTTSSVAPNLKPDIIKSAPLVSPIGALYRCQAVVRDELSMPGEDWRLVAKGLPADESVERMIDWLEGGALAMAIEHKVWRPVRDMISDGFLRDLHSHAR